MSEDSIVAHISKLLHAFDEVRQKSPPFSEDTQGLLEDYARRDPAEVLGELDSRIYTCLIGNGGILHNVREQHYTLRTALAKSEHMQKTSPNLSERQKTFLKAVYNTDNHYLEFIDRRLVTHTHQVGALGKEVEEITQASSRNVVKRPLPDDMDKISFIGIQTLITKLIEADIRNLVSGGGWFLNKMTYLSQTILPLFQNADPSDPAIAGWESDREICANAGQAFVISAQDMMRHYNDYRAPFLDHARSIGFTAEA